MYIKVSCDKNFYFLQLKVCMLVDKHWPVLGVILWFPIFSSPATRRLIVTSYSWGRPLLWASRSPVHPGLGPVSHPTELCTRSHSQMLLLPPFWPFCLQWLLISCSHEFSNFSPPVNTLPCSCTLPQIRMRPSTPFSFSQLAGHSPGALSVSPHP